MKPRALTLLTLLLASLAASAQSPLIGIFEARSSGRGDSQGQPGVRVLFYQSGHQWRSYNAVCHDEACLRTITHLFPPTTTWTLVRSGKPLTKVTANTPAAFHFYSEIGVQAITNPAAVVGLEPRPTPRNPNPPHTILATNLATLTDPDNWQPSSLPAADLTRTRQAFRKSFPRPNNCTPGQATPTPRPWTYTDDDIHPDATFLSNKGWRIVQITLEHYLCDGPLDPAFVDHWYAVGPMGQIHPLGPLMHFTAAADFARNGRSALLFSSEDENNGGYKLFYDNFAREAQATITHH